MTNLYEETLDKLQEHNKTFDDVKYVKKLDEITNIETFIAFAEGYNYYAGYGYPSISTDLQLIGDNWWLERAEHDGAEWWEFKTLPDISKCKFVTDMYFKE